MERIILRIEIKRNEPKKCILKMSFNIMFKGRKTLTAKVYVKNFYDCYNYLYNVQRPDKCFIFHTI